MPQGHLPAPGLLRKSSQAAHGGGSSSPALIQDPQRMGIVVLFA
jgi:hypothetical protein